MGAVRLFPIAGALLWALAPVTAAPKGDAPNLSAPTAVERALVDLRCSAIPLARVPGTAVRDECQRAQLAEIRADFGRDFGRLSVGDRRKLDAACGALLTPRARESYVDCLNTELTSFKDRRRPQRPQEPEDPRETAPSILPAAADTQPSATPTVQAPGDSTRSAGRHVGLWAGLAVVIAGAAAAAARLLKKTRPTELAQAACRVCGAAVPDGGDLCQTCRHQAVEALKHAAEQRATEERAAERRAGEEQAARHERERARAEAAEQEEQNRRRASLDDLAEQARQRRDEEQQARARFDGAAAAATDQASPYAVLGVSPDASPAEIAAAYEAAKDRYNTSLAADFGLEVQKHFEVKRAAVERAYAELVHPVDA